MFVEQLFRIVVPFFFIVEDLNLWVYLYHEQILQDVTLFIYSRKDMITFVSEYCKYSWEFLYVPKNFVCAKLQKVAFSLKSSLRLLMC